MSSPHHRPLNQKQLDILHTLYRFRFATTELLTQALNTKSKIKMNERLKVLLDQEYIGRNFNSEYRLLRKHASYYLMSKGIDALSHIPDKYTASVLRNIRKDKAASDQFIDYCLGIFSIYCQLKELEGDALHFFTKSQLANKYDYFSEFVPAAYMRLTQKHIEQDYFLEYLQASKPFFTVIQRLKQYFEYADSGEWENGTESTFPRALFICDTPSLRKRLLRSSMSLLDEANDEFRLYVTTEDNLGLWINPASPDATLSLGQI